MTYLRTLHEFPCGWDDLRDSKGRTHVTIYTLEEARRLPQEELDAPGISHGSDGVWDIVLDVPELTKDLVKRGLVDLSERTGIEYKLQQ
jgi:hypothetical protein